VNCGCRLAETLACLGADVHHLEVDTRQLVQRLDRSERRRAEEAAAAEERGRRLEAKLDELADRFAAFAIDVGYRLEELGAAVVPLPAPGVPDRGIAGLEAGLRQVLAELAELRAAAGERV
jgi:hypothetical protein